MTTLNIEGKKVTVDDSFLKLSPEEQNRTVDEIAAEIGVSDGASFMGNVNRGIARAIGGAVDFVNPFDQPHALNPFPEGTGSAREGLEQGMRFIGADVAEGEPDTVMGAVGQGVGEAAGALIPVAGALGKMRTAGGVVGSVADDALRAMASRLGVSVEALAGGLSGGAEQLAEDAGAPEWVQNTAAIAAPMSIPAAAGVVGMASKVTPGGNAARLAARNIAGAVAPYTKAGGREVARQRIQSLAGGPDRAEELARRMVGGSEINLSPARRTGDPNMIGLEDLARSQDPNLRARLEAAETASRGAARENISGMGGDVEDARNFISQRQRQFASDLQERADAAIQRADERIKSIGPRATEEDNARIVMEEIERSLGDALSQEKALWDAVPRGAQVPTDRAKSVAQSLIAETPRAQRGDVPRVVRELLAEDGEFGNAETVAEMHGLYSELRRVARSAMAGNDQNKNMARIANETADAILRDLGAVDADTDIGRAINEARTFSAQLHETFYQGAVGRLRTRTLDGDTAIDPELSLQRTIGRGGQTASVANRQILQATGRGNAELSIDDYLRDRFAKAVTSPSEEFTGKSARKFMRDNEPLLNQYPKLRKEIMSAVSNRESADALQARVADVIKRSKSSRQSALSGFLDGPPEKAINSVFTSQNPIKAARILRAAVGKDKTGEALAGLKGAFADKLIGGSLRTVGGETQIDPDRLTSMLDNGQMSRALRIVFSPDEMQRMRRIADELSRLDMAGENVGASLSGAKPNKLIEYAIRVVAARQGAELGGGSGGSLQTAQMASSRAKDFLGRLVSDKASQILSDAIEDPELFRILLTDVGKLDIQKDAIPHFLPYLVGGASAAFTGE